MQALETESPQVTSKLDVERQPMPVAIAYCVLNWIVPGAGYLAARDMKRGIALAILLNGIFLLGLAYDGYLYVPPLAPADPAFNIVSLLTFIVQCCHAGGVLILLGAEKAFGPDSVLVRNPGGPFSDLGSFHFLVAGALNYFATTRLYDLLAGDPCREERKEPVDSKGEGDA